MALPVVTSNMSERISAVAEWNALFAPPAASAYDGASHSKPMRNWQPTDGDADSTIGPDLPMLRVRSRDAYRNDPTARSALDTATRSVVGSGLTARANIDYEYLEMDSERASAWNTTYERDWLRWARSFDCDVTRMCNFSGLTSLAFLTAYQSGECFALLGIENGDLSIRLIEPDRVSTPPHKIHAGNIRNGIEVDERGRPVAVWIRSKHPGDYSNFSGQFRWDRVRIRGKRTGRLNVLHLYKVERPGQHRGVPYLAPVLEHLRKLTEYTRAELQAAVVSSMFTAFLKPPPAGANYGAAAQRQTEEYLEWAGSLGPGMIGKLPAGADMVFANPLRPNGNFDSFVNTITRGIGAALGIPVEILLKKISTNYTSYRGAVIEAWKAFYADQHWLIEHWCNPIWRERMDIRVANREIAAPGYFQDPATRFAYNQVTWNGPTMAQIDPLKETNAFIAQADSGLTTWTAAARSLNGSDYSQNLKQHERERKAREESGFASAPKKQAAPAAAAGPPPDPEESEEEDALPEKEVASAA